MPLTIVIGTGRCGSTMLSRMLSMHPDVLSLSEFWNVLRTTADNIPTHVMTGAEFWARITRPDPYTDGMEQAGIPHDEFLYPADRGRFDPAAGVPAICRVLSELTDDPDALHDELAPEVPAWPRRPMAAHCRALFGDLTARLGRRVVVERTGGDANLIPALREQFPEANFVFLHRNGPDTALSMSRHPSYRLAALQMFAAAAGQPTPPSRWPGEIGTARSEDFEGLAAPPFDRQRFLAYPIPLVMFGWMWSGGTRSGTSDIRAVPPERWVLLRYENLLADTRAELSRLADFIGVPAERQWLDRTSEFVDSGRAGGAAARLHPSALAELRAACASGARAFDLLESEHAASAKLPG